MLIIKENDNKVINKYANLGFLVFVVVLSLSLSLWSGCKLEKQEEREREKVRRE